MNRIKKLLLDLAAKWHATVSRHQLLMEGKPIAQVNSVAGYRGPFDLQKELERLDVQRDSLYARSEFEALMKSFEELYIPAGWAMLFVGEDYREYTGFNETRHLLDLRHDGYDYEMVVFTEGRHAHAGIFKKGPPGVFLRPAYETKIAVACGRTKEELLLAMICMDKQEEKQYA